MSDLAKEREKTLASIIRADPHPDGGPLALVYFGITSIARDDPVVFALDHGIAHPKVAGERWFNDLVRVALEIGGALAIQEFEIDPASFPARLAMFWDSEALFVPAMLAADRLIT
jgi:hypothetical protein